MMKCCRSAVVLFMAACLVLAVRAAPDRRGFRDREDNLIAVLEHYMHVLAQQSPAHHNQGGLTMGDTSNERVEGTFVTKDGHGVFFLSENEDSGKNKLLITTLEGQNLIYVLQLREEVTFISVANESLLYYHSEEGDDIYRVTPSHLFIMLNAVQENTNFEIDLLREHLPKMSEKDGTASLNHILDFPDEIQMVIDTAKAMSKEGLSGEHNPSLRVLFAAVLNLEYALWEKEMKSSIQTNKNNQHFVSQLSSTQKEAFFQATEREEQCTTYDTTCPIGRCPYDRLGNRCFGMCGRGCTCWNLLCGDCCTHRGCIEHDACCAKSGLRARIRCYVPLGFGCDARFRC